MSNLCSCFSPKEVYELYCLDCKFSIPCCFVSILGTKCNNPGKYLGKNNTANCFVHAAIDINGFNKLHWKRKLDKDFSNEEYAKYFQLDIKCSVCSRLEMILDLNNICMDCRLTGGAPY